MTSLEIGHQAEQSALFFLQQQGMSLKQQNYHCRLGEIDLIMQQDNTLAFIEVRYRKSNQFGAGYETVTKTKQNKIINTAKHYLQKHNLTDKIACRFDVISISGSDFATIDWIPNAFN